jgi:Rab5 GDP/GTP exchange factor
MGAIQFIENLDRTSLTISDEDFEKNVELAVSAIAEREQDQPTSEKEGQASEPLNEKSESSKVFNEKQALHQPHPKSLPVVRPIEPQESENSSDEKAAIAGLLRTFQRPLSNIGRMFSDETTTSQYPGNLRIPQGSSAPPETPRRLSPSLIQPPRSSTESSEARSPRSPRLSAEDAAARQASAEAAEAQRITRAEHKDVVEYVAANFFFFLSR